MAEYFDALCGIAERGFVNAGSVGNDYKDLVSRACLFIVPPNLNVTLPPASDREAYSEEALGNLFFLPFPVFAAEDGNGVVLLADFEENAVGLHLPRKMIDVVRVPNSDKFEVRLGVFQGGELEGAGIRVGMKLLYVGDGTKKNFSWSLRNSDSGYVGLNRYANRTSEVINKAAEDSRQAMMKNVGVAIRECTYFAHKERFIVEVLPKSTKKGDKKIPRTHQRSKFTTLSLGEIKRLSRGTVGSTQGSGERAEVLFRRQHPRTFRSDRFTKMQGKTIIIEAKWFGSTRFDANGKTYIVRTDR